MLTETLNSFGTRATLKTPNGDFDYYSLAALQDTARCNPAQFPVSIKILLEAMLRNEDGKQVSGEDIERLCVYDATRVHSSEIPFNPARVILQDFTGVPSVVDLAALRSAMARLGGDPKRINPQVPVDLVIDHSVQVDVFGKRTALKENAAIEFKRNRERYAFLRWGQQAFDNFRVVPPASGIVHQVNLEYLSPAVASRRRGDRTEVYPDSLVGTDSHTTMINGLGVVGWGVGGIEAEAVMLGQPIYMLIPEVVGFSLSGQLKPGVTATDLVLTVTEMLRHEGVVGKFVEFCGPGLDNLTLPDRATIANMAPEYGATMGFFPLDGEALRYLRSTGRPPELVDLVERYTKEQGLFRTPETAEPAFGARLELTLDSVEPCLAGPKRPQDRILLSDMQTSWRKALRAPVTERGFALKEPETERSAMVKSAGQGDYALRHGDVVIAAITSCTNTSNPSVLIGAGVLARKARRAGLVVKPYVKTSLAPGSKVVTEYLRASGLLEDLEALGFYVVGYGCTTCIGNSGPLPEPISAAIEEGRLVAASVLSGNRNFEGRVSPHVRANYLGSPPLVVAYALAGTVDIDLTNDPIGQGSDGKAVYLSDVWPSPSDIAEHLDNARDPEVFRKQYHGVEQSNAQWNEIPVSGGELYQWNQQSTYIQEPPFFVGINKETTPICPISGARVLVKVGDSVTTDHISPAGAIAKDSPAATYLQQQGVLPEEFNSYGSRRGNDRVMTRGTFANVRLRNQLAPGTEGGFTTHLPSGQVGSVFEAAERYKQDGTPTIVLAGRDYGMGSSRDWAAKGTYLLGIRAVLAVSYERIHRSNLVGMGVLPLEFLPGDSADKLGLSGHEHYDIRLDDQLRPGQKIVIDVRAPEQDKHFSIATLCRIDTPVEVDYYRNGGILHTVLRQML